jgi:hypothetical protein
MFHFSKLNTKYKILFEILKNKFSMGYLLLLCLIISKFRFTNLTHEKKDFYWRFNIFLRF